MLKTGVLEFDACFPDSVVGFQPGPRVTTEYVQFLLGHLQSGLERVPRAAQVEVEEIAPATWVAVHLPRRKMAERAFVGDRRGYWLRLKFSEPVVGPLRVGHSSSFGLGLFRPVCSNSMIGGLST